MECKLYISLQCAVWLTGTIVFAELQVTARQGMADDEDDGEWARAGEQLRYTLAFFSVTP